ncbi:fimbrial chaperone protein, partial [Salmonella enterica]|nr:fimbrial chaperone protein [Salmonella enterica]
QIKVLNNSGKYYLENPTPYYFAVTQLNVNGEKVALKKNEADKLAKFVPFSKVELSKPLMGAVSFNAIDDYGASNVYSVK